MAPLMQQLNMIESQNPSVNEAELMTFVATNFDIILLGVQEKVFAECNMDKADVDAVKWRRFLGAAQRILGPFDTSKPMISMIFSTLRVLAFTRVACSVPRKTNIEKKIKDLCGRHDKATEML